MGKVTLSLSLEEAKILYETATNERRLELENLFPELKPKDIRDRVKSYEDALKVLRIDHFDEANLYPREIARRKLEIIIEALNEGWKPNWDDIHQLKWYPYFYLSDAGLGFSNAYISPSAAHAYFGVRLCLKSEELAEYTGTQFIELYKTMSLE